MNGKQMVATTEQSNGPAEYELGGSLAVSLARSEVDLQITTARAYPRSISRAVEHILTLATLDEKTADKCIYALKRDNKLIKGPSIRLAEIVASQWGNCRVGARVVHVDRFEKFVEAEGVFHDLETNMATTARTRRRISTKEGKLFSEDMIIVTGNAACAIAKRNAIFGAVPQGVWGKGYDAVESVITGDVKTLTSRRANALKTLTAEYKITAEQIFQALEIGGEDDIDLERLAMLTAMRASLKNGEATVDELFPKELPRNGAPRGLEAKLDAIAAGGNAESSDNLARYGDQPHDPGTGEVMTDAKAMEAAGRAFAAREEERNEDARRELDREAEAAEEAARQLAAKLQERAEDIKGDPQHRWRGWPDPLGSAKVIIDPETQKLLDAGRAMATNGKAKFKRWENNLGAPDFERIKPYLDELRKAAAPD